MDYKELEHNKHYLIESSATEHYVTKHVRVVFRGEKACLMEIIEPNILPNNDHIKKEWHVFKHDNFWGIIEELTQFNRSETLKQILNESSDSTD